MADETLEDGGAAPDSGRVKRPPPTIDLTASEVTTEPAAEPVGAPQSQDGPEKGPQASAEPPHETDSPSISPAPAPPPARSSVSPWVIAPFSGAVAAALVIGVGWMLGWPPVQPPSEAPQVNAAIVDDLAARLTAVEAKAGKPASDPAAAARIDALDKMLASFRGDLAKQRTQSDQLAADVSGLKAGGHNQAAAPVDLSGINDRLAKLEQTASTQGAAIATETTKTADTKPADDLPLRRVVAAALLDVAVRHGDPYASTLAAAKALAPDPDALKPLDTFAATGVPNPPTLNREFLALVPKLSPPPADTVTTGTGIVDRLQAGASKLVHIERTDTTGNDRGAIVARLTQAALHNNLAETLRELNSLAPADRAPAQAWLDKVNARDAALDASRHFADDAMAALAKPAQ